jgi:hypothetical protein
VKYTPPSPVPTSLQPKNDDENIMPVFPSTRRISSKSPLPLRCPPRRDIRRRTSSTRHHRHGPTSDEPQAARASGYGSPSPPRRVGDLALPSHCSDEPQPFSGEAPVNCPLAPARSDLAPTWQPSGPRVRASMNRLAILEWKKTGSTCGWPRSGVARPRAALVRLHSLTATCPCPAQ